jgi:hypothetical protein
MAFALAAASKAAVQSINVLPYPVLDILSATPAVFLQPRPNETFKCASPDVQTLGILGNAVGLKFAALRTSLAIECRFRSRLVPPTRTACDQPWKQITLLFSGHYDYWGRSRGTQAQATCTQSLHEEESLSASQMLQNDGADEPAMPSEKGKNSK